MNFPCLFKHTETTTATAPWPWPSCANTPKTLSFRAPSLNIYKTEHFENDDIILGGLKSERLIFEPGKTSSILEESKSHVFPYKESTALMALDSNDPILDFRVSMEEIVEAHGLKDWESLEELLTCYLNVNVKSNHGYIVGAFVDLLLNLALASAYSDDSSNLDTIDEEYSTATTTDVSFTSHLSFSSSIESSTSPSMENEDVIVIKC